MKLIIAEKPSLGRNIADAIGKPMRRNGYFECGEYVITWVFGHLFSLADIEHYSPKKKKGWSFDNIPCFPENFDYELGDDEGIQKQFQLIENLCNRSDVTDIINAGDADREGEIIVRTTVKKALKTEKPLFRLWLPDQTPQTVRAALSDLELDSNYDNLANEGYARTYIDWLYGVNLTRYASILTGKLLRVGRVIVPIVKAIYDRDLAIRNFKPVKYYGISSKTTIDGEEVVLNSKKEFSKDELESAKELCRDYNLEKTIVVDKKSKEDILPPGKLYSLSTLQNVLGKKYKMSMKESLDVVQGLYEKGYLTYPRTNSEYLATAEKGKIRQIIEGVSKLGYAVSFRDSKYIFDDTKIESHSALTPTYKIPKQGDLTEKEKNVYSTVLRRFVAVFCSEVCRVEKSEITIKTGEMETFQLKGMIMVEPGWTKYDDYSKKDKSLPNLSVGQIIETYFQPQEKETTPPKHYTIETLNNYLKNPFKEDKAQVDDQIESDEEDYRAIFEGLELGTEATRTGIIDNARSTKYIELNKDVYSILPDGEYLIESLQNLGISMDKYKTSQMGQALKKVYRGEITVSDSTDLAREEIEEIFSHKEEILSRIGDTGEEGEIVGTCPKCASQVVRAGSKYACENSNCDFRFSASILRKVITPDMAKLLLSIGSTPVIDGFISKRGKAFSAPLKMVDGQVVFDLPESHEGESIKGVKCPVCGKKMEHGRYNYLCSVKKCGFSIGKTILKHELSEDELKEYTTSGISPLISDFVSKSDGSKFSAYLVLRGNETKIVPPQKDGTQPAHDIPTQTKTKEKTEKTPKPKAKKVEESKATTLPPCPICGGKIVRGKLNYGCLGYVNGCTFRIPFELGTIALNDADVTDLISGKMVSKTGTNAKIDFIFQGGKLLHRENKL